MVILYYCTDNWTKWLYKTKLTTSLEDSQKLRACDAITLCDTGHMLQVFPAIIKWMNSLTNSSQTVMNKTIIIYRDRKECQNKAYSVEAKSV